MSWFRPGGLIELRPHHTLFFENHSREEITLWICFNREWYFVADITPGESILPIPVSSGVRLEWRILSSRAILEFNQINAVELNSRLESVYYIAELVHWRGGFRCTREMMGRHTEIIVS